MKTTPAFPSPAAWAVCAVAACAVAALAVAVAGSRPIEPPAVRDATPSAHAAQAVTLGVAHAGDRLVAVGERGLVLLSDGIYEYEDAQGRPFGRARVEQTLQDGAQGTPAALAAQLMRAVQAHAGGRAQQDDITVVLLKREVGP